MKIKKLKAKSMALGMALLLLTSVSAQAEPFVYVPLTLTTTVLDTETYLPVAYLPTRTYNIEVGRNGNTLYGTAYHSDTVSVYDAATGTLLTTIPIGTTITDLVVSLPANRAYATSSSAGTVTVIDITTNTAIHTITVNPNPSKLAVSHDGRRAYVYYGSGNVVSVIDTATNSVVNEIALNVGSSPGTPYIRDIVASPVDHYVYALSMASPNYIHVIDTDTDTEVTRFSTTFGMGSLVATPGKLYLIRGKAWNSTIDDVFVFDRQTGAPITSFNSGAAVSLKIAKVHPDGNSVYVTATKTIGVGRVGLVVIIDAISDQVIDMRALNEDPRGDLAFSPIPEPVGGSASAVKQLNVVCTNLSTSQQVTIPLPAGNTWDCENAGLVVYPGDQVNMKVTGNVK